MVTHHTSQNSSAHSVTPTPDEFREYGDDFGDDVGDVDFDAVQESGESVSRVAEGERQAPEAVVGASEVQ